MSDPKVEKKIKGEEDGEIVSNFFLVLSAKKKLSIESPKQWENSKLRSKGENIKGELVSSREDNQYKKNSPLEDIWFLWYDEQKR